MKVQIKGNEFIISEATEDQLNSKALKALKAGIEVKGYNPLAYLKDKTGNIDGVKVRKLVQELVNDPDKDDDIFIKMKEALFSAVIYLCLEEMDDDLQNLRTVTELAKEGVCAEDSTKSELDMVFERAKENAALEKRHPKYLEMYRICRLVPKRTANCVALDLYYTLKPVADLLEYPEIKDETETAFEKFNRMRKART